MHVQEWRRILPEFPLAETRQQSRSALIGLSGHSGPNGADHTCLYYESRLPASVIVVVLGRTRLASLNPYSTATAGISKLAQQHLSSENLSLLPQSPPSSNVRDAAYFSPHPSLAPSARILSRTRHATLPRASSLTPILIIHPTPILPSIHPPITFPKYSVASSLHPHQHENR